MNTKLISLVIVGVLLGSSFGCIIVITETKVADAIEVSAQSPHFAQPNPDFVKYQQDLVIGNASYRANAHVAAGFIPPPVSVKQLTGQSIRGALVGAPSVPASYDLRKQNKLTPVKDQGECGDCWAFATFASLESYLKPTETWDFSENNMKNTHGFHIAPCDGGNEFMATAYLARWSGPVSEAADPYGGTSPTNLPVQKHVQDVSFLPDRAGPTDNDNIKIALVTYGAVYTTLYVGNMDSPQFNSATNAYYDSQSKLADHAVAIVGWDDSYSRTNFKAGNQPLGDGAFIVKNSWGTSWGDHGYFYASYYDANIGKYNAVFTAQPTTNYNSIYQHDPLGFTAPFGQGTSDWGANIFTATGNENLAAVSFYTQDLNAPYDVYVYTDPTAGPINPSGPVAHVTGSTPLPGYHTVPLGSSVSLRAGQRFSVVVKFTASGGTPIPTEAPVIPPIVFSSQARANVGESYYHADNADWQKGSTWTDMTSYQANTNICIKAFATTATTGPGYESLGGYLTSSPAAVSWGNGRIDGFARGTDGALWHQGYHGTWDGWKSLGGYLAPGTGPAVSSWGAGRLDVFVVGTDNELWYKYYQSGSGWSGWYPLGGYLTSSPAAVSWGNGRLDIFARGTDGALWQKHYENGWSTWTPLGGYLAPGTGPAVSSWAAGRLDLFVVGTDNQLWHM